MFGRNREFKYRIVIRYSNSSLLFVWINLDLIELYLKYREKIVREDLIKRESSERNYNKKKKKKIVTESKKRKQ